MNKQELKQAIKRVLHNAVTGEYEDSSHGACYMVQDCGTAQVLCRLAALSKGWQHHSGNSFYPVPGGEIGYESTPYKWRGDQLNYRISLLLHWLNKLEAE